MTKESEVSEDMRQATLAAVCEYWKEWSWNSATISIAVTDDMKKLMFDFATDFALHLRTQRTTNER